MKICNLGNRIVNNYLIPCDGGYILIDTGYESGFRRFQRKLAENGIRPEDIRYVFLTHAHDDHAGFLNDVLAITNAKVILHPLAIERLKKGQNSFEGGCSGRLAWLFCKVLALAGHGDHRYPAVRDEYLDRLVSIDSEQFRALCFPYGVVKTPGHTADHISLIAGDDLFCGDAVMNGFPSRRRTIIWIENLKEYRESWSTILRAGPVRLYPAHGKPFRTNDLEKYLPALDKVRLYPLK